MRALQQVQAAIQAYLPLWSYDPDNSLVLNVSPEPWADLLDELQNRLLGSGSKAIPYSADKYAPFEKQLLDFYSVLVDPKYLIMDNQVTMRSEMSNMKWVLLDPQNHKVGHAWEWYI